MSEASFKNFAAEQRHRERRTMYNLLNPGVSGNLPDPAMDSLWGSLSDRRDEAQANGLNFRLDGSSIGGGGSVRRPSLASMGRPGAEDAAYSYALNQGLSDMQDDRRAREQAVRAQRADADHREAVAKLAQAPTEDRAAIDRAYAVSNIPAGVDPAEIHKTGDGAYVSRGAGPLADPRVVMARNLPGHLQPVAAPVTFGAPQAAMVGGKRQFVRAGSDGQMYDMSRQPIAPDALAPDSRASDAAPTARPLTQTAEANLVAKLANQWVAANKTNAEMTRQFQIMKAGLDRFDADPSGASQAVLVTFQKMLDPESVVRESEYARSSQGVSAIQRMHGYMERLASGGAGVPKAQLAEMIKTAEQFKENTKDAPEGARKRIGSVAERYGIPPELVFSAPGASSGGPPAGETPEQRFKRLQGGG